ncbi:MAG TPA: hypothetical protein VK148_14705 [Xanthobacteraceae bacterium]|nr:hypothetical protein [Xanthobacteraceae bacterium]
MTRFSISGAATRRTDPLWATQTGLTERGHRQLAIYRHVRTLRSVIS